jgi:hypothetical protein
METSNPGTIVLVLVGAAAVGGVVGFGSLATTSEGRAAVAKSAAAVATGAGAVAATAGFKRSREPQANDFWSGCNDARAAGTAPIYRGEPGYRPEMDGDDDGVACEMHGGSSGGGSSSFHFGHRRRR